MSENTNNNAPAQNPNPIYIMPPQQSMSQNDIFSGLGGIVCSVLAGLILGQLGISFPRLPKL
jgi:hypothetical protein